MSLEARRHDKHASYWLGLPGWRVAQVADIVGPVQWLDGTLDIAANGRRRLGIRLGGNTILHGAAEPVHVLA